MEDRYLCNPMTTSEIESIGGVVNTPSVLGGRCASRSTCCYSTKTRSRAVPMHSLQCMGSVVLMTSASQGTPAMTKKKSYKAIVWTTDGRWQQWSGTCLQPMVLTNSLMPTVENLLLGEIRAVVGYRS